MDAKLIEQIDNEFLLSDFLFISAINDLYQQQIVTAKKLNIRKKKKSKSI
jgi:hypothetical protein